MNPFHDKNCSVLLCVETSFHLCLVPRGEGVVEGGRKEGFVKRYKSCLYVCCKNENKKMIKKKAVEMAMKSLVRVLAYFLFFGQKVV